MVWIVAEGPESLGAYASISIAFSTASRLDPDALRDPAGSRWVEHPMPVRHKDYDAEAGEGPRRWALQFDLTNWGILVAYDGETRSGGAAVAFDTPDVEMLEARRDLAVLWDLRVHPESRGRGTGRRLFAAAVAWARERGCAELRVETQDINVAACRFYRAQGCGLLSVDRDGYEGLDEAKIVWTLPLESGPRVH